MNKDTEGWQGTSLDEWDRMKDSRQNWYRHVYPFIEIIPLNRNQCVA